MVVASLLEPLVTAKSSKESNPLLWWIEQPWQLRFKLAKYIDMTMAIVISQAELIHARDLPKLQSLEPWSIGFGPVWSAFETQPPDVLSERLAHKTVH